MNRNEQKILVFFAGLWSAIEVSLGTILSLSKIPFRGLLLASIGCFFYRFLSVHCRQTKSEYLFGFDCSSC